VNKGAKNDMKVSSENALKGSVTFPKYEEQKSIAEFFSVLDNLITLHQRKLVKLRNIKKSMLEKMFPKSGSKIPEVRFAGFTDDWEQCKLGDMCSSFEYGLNAAATTYDGKNKYLRITDIDDSSHRFNYNDLTSPDTNIDSADGYKLNEGDILFARTGASVGKTYLYRHSDGLVYFAGFLIRAKIKPEYDDEFVFQNTFTDEYSKFIRITSQRSGQPGVNAQEYGEYAFSIPKEAEQTKIGAFFANLDHLITLHQRALEKLQNIKKSCLEKMFV
jgi:type I restriction enzyme S subunit